MLSEAQYRDNTDVLSSGETLSVVVGQVLQRFNRQLIPDFMVQLMPEPGPDPTLWNGVPSSANTASFSCERFFVSGDLGNLGIKSGFFSFITFRGFLWSISITKEQNHIKTVFSDRFLFFLSLTVFCTSSPLDLDRDPDR